MKKKSSVAGRSAGRPATIRQDCPLVLHQQLREAEVPGPGVTFFLLRCTTLREVTTVTLMHEYIIHIDM